MTLRYLLNEFWEENLDSYPALNQETWDIFGDTSWIYMKLFVESAEEIQNFSF